MSGHIQVFPDYISIYDGERYTKVELTKEQKIHLLGELSLHVAHILRLEKINEESL